MIINLNKSKINALLNFVAIVDLLANECGLALANALKLPVAGFWGFNHIGAEVMYTSNFNPPSVVPALYSGLSRQMRFDERVVNFLINIFERLLLMYQTSIVESYTRQNFPDLPSIPQMIHDVDVTLVNTNQLLDYPKLTSPNTKYLGGMQLKRKTESLQSVSKSEY